MPKSLFVQMQYLCPQHLLSRLAGQLAGCRIVGLKNWAIRTFIRHYQVDMSSAAIENAEEYPDFNSFFTRALKPTARPIAQDPNAIVSPADSCISQMGQISKNTLIQAKNFDFSTDALLGSSELAREFDHGEFITLYLAPKDYHRVHMPVKGKLRKTIFIPGKLFSVNQQTALAIPNLFARNERLVCLFDTEQGPMAVILVGAMIVGSISTVWHNTYCFTKVTEEEPAGITLERGAELGHFQLGSTVILLFPKNVMKWRDDLEACSVVKMGEAIAKLKK